MEMVLVVLFAIVLMWRLQQKILQENEQLIVENQRLMEQVAYQQRAIRELQWINNYPPPPALPSPNSHRDSPENAGQVFPPASPQWIHNAP